jgi:glycosyltransferase involved in cell wall biosynthesis
MNGIGGGHVEPRRTMADDSQRAEKPRASVIIPARNEALGIARTLRSLFRGIAPDDLEVIVACDGCTDDTAEIVRELGLGVRVVEIPPSGKSGALRAAEALTSTLPRIYLDADVEVAGGAVLSVVETLHSGALAARPPVRFCTDGASWLVRRYYAARRRIPSVLSDLCGAGIYGLAARARARFGDFPEVTADDLFAARIVRSEEVTIVPCEHAVVTTPRTARALLHILARTYRGNREIRRGWPQLDRRPASRTGWELLRQLRNPSAWPDVGVYLGFSLLGRLAATLSRRGWERDETSRRSAGPRRAREGQG